MTQADRKSANPPEKLHYFKLCYREWAHGTRGLSLSAKMFYLELLLWSWDKQRPLPRDPEKIARDIGVTKRQWAKYWPIVSGKFKREKHGYWQARVKADVTAYREAHRARVDGGRKGAQRRWSAREEPPNDLAASQAEYAQNPPSTEPVFRQPSNTAQAIIDAGKQLAPSAGNPHHKPTNLINGASLRRHGSHAWCSPRDGLCVPQFLHEEFLGKSNKPPDELLAWYASSIAALNGHAVGEDALVFWRNTFAGWVGTVTASPDTDSKSARTMAAARRVASGNGPSLTDVFRKVARPS